MQPAIVWCGFPYPDDVWAILRSGLEQRGYQVLVPPVERLTLPVCPPGDPLIGQASIVFGKPNPDDLLTIPRLRWIHLTSAGYEQYDREDLRVALRQRGVPLTNTSTVYAEPCAEHVLAMMTGL